MNKGRFGADYYPEHWPESRWQTDAEMMQEMGLSVVRMGEFSWAKFEPSRGQFDFAWLDKAIDILLDHGISTIIGTPTATPPAWIIEQNPEILPVDSQGRVRGFGGRHHDCQSSDIYREHVRRIVTAMAKHYADTPGVIGWQIDNEFGNSHQDLCHCDSCRNQFQIWLKKKYGSIKVLNQAWGTDFWSQTYDRFEQIPTLGLLPTDKGHNPSHHLDWKRFCSDLIVDFQQLQIEIIRAACPGHFITHNFMGFADKVSYFDLAKSLDFASHDQYPMGFFHQNPPWLDSARISANLDLVRGTRQQTFWIMEQQSGPAGWTTIGRTPRPGQLRLWTAHSVAHGADSVVYFRWRTCSYGTEEYWHGILPHSGNPGRRYDELKQTVAELAPLLPEIQESKPEAEVAILYSYDQKWALDIQPHHPQLEYINQVMGYYGALHTRNIPVDFQFTADDLSAYKLVIAPLLFLVDDDLIDSLISYVEQGGCLLLTMRSGVKDWNNVCLTQRELPGRLGDLLGIEIRDYDCLQQLEQTIVWNDGKEHLAAKWADIVTLQSAKPLAVYKKEYYADTPAVTVNNYGQGKAIYVATEPDSIGMTVCTDKLINLCGLESLGQTPDGVELTRRRLIDRDYIFALNHTPEDKSLDLPSEWTAIIGSRSLTAYDYALFLRSR